MVFVTYETKESNIRKTLSQIENFDGVDKVVSLLRVEE